MSLTDSESNETQCEESFVDERIDVGIVQPYANGPFAHKSGEYDHCEDVQHGLLPVVGRFEGEVTLNKS